jgi:hypothetical protein
MRDRKVCNLFVGYSHVDNQPINEGHMEIFCRRIHLKVSKENMVIPLDKWREFNG